MRTGEIVGVIALKRSAPIVLVVALLVWPAVWNGIPLIFPDTAPYLGLAYDNSWTVDRSAFYAMFLVPPLRLVDGTAGLWAAVLLQATVLALVLIATLRKLTAVRSHWLLGLPIALVALVTSLPWHAAQLMPDAFTGVVVLGAWLAVMRDPEAPGSALLWLLVALLATTHVTHIGVMFAALGAALATCAWGAKPKMLGRSLAAAWALLLAAILQIAANGLVMGQWKISPMGPAFLFARLNEDGVMNQWSAKHCGSEPVCEVQALAPLDSQETLWGRLSPLYPRVWNGTAAHRWGWIEALDRANRQAIFENPGLFLSASLRQGAAQFFTFETLDDACPRPCGDQSEIFLYTIKEIKPALVPAFTESPQVRGMLPKGLIRTLTFPGTLAGLILIFPTWLLAVRRKDIEGAALLGAVILAIFVNALLTGALSEVNARYQSRIVWLALFAVLAVAVRWNLRPAQRERAA